MAEQVFHDMLNRTVSIDNNVNIIKQMLDPTQKKKTVGTKTEVPGKQGPDALQENLDKLIPGFQKLIKEQEKELDLLKEANKAKEKAQTAPKKRGTVGGTGGGGIADITDPDTVDALAKAMQRYNIQIKNVNKSTVSLGKAAAATFLNMTAGGNLFESIFGRGMHKIIGDQYRFQMGMRDIAFQTEGITKAANGMFKEWEQVGKSVSQTGQAAEVFQQSLLTQMKRGTRGLQDEIRLTKTSLNLSTMIGANAADIAGTFHEWHVQMGLDNIQMAEISRGAQRVARETGITGDNLAAVIKKTQAIVQQMRNYGNLSAAAVNNMMGLTAQAEKAGVDLGDIQSALMGGSNLFLKSSNETQNLMLLSAQSAGKVNELLMGTLKDSKAGMKAFAKGMHDVTMQLGVDLDHLDQATPEQLFKANIIAQSLFGKHLGELAKDYEAIKEQGKGFGERMDDLNKELSKGNLTTKERIKLEENRRKMIEDEGFQLMTAFSEASKSGGTMAEGMDKALKKLGPEFDAELKQMGVSAADPVGKLQQAAQITAESIKKAGGKDLTADVSKAINSGNTAKVRELLEEMNDEAQKAGVKQAKNLDPVKAAAQYAEEISDTLRQYSAKALGYLADIVHGKTLFGLQAVASLFTNKVTGTLIGSIFDRFKGTSAGALTVESFKKLTKPGGWVAKTLTKVEEHTGIKLLKKEEMLRDAKGRFVKKEKPTAAADAAGGATEDEKGTLGDTLAKNIKEISSVKSVDAGGLLKGGMQLVKAALALAVVATALLAVATAVGIMYKVMTKLTGVTPKDMEEMGLVLAGILIGMSALVGAIKLADKLKVFDNMAEFNKKAFGMAKELLIGAAGLAVLTTALLALTMAITLIAKAMFLVISAEEVKQTAEAIASILWSLAKIAGAVAIGVVALMALGAFAIAILDDPFTAAAFAALMLAGAGALLVLTPAMMLLASAVIKMCEGIMKYVVSPEEAAQTSDGVATILWSAAKIAGSMVLSVASLTVLGLLSPIAIWAVPLMWAGAKTLTILTAATVVFASAILKFCQEIMKIIISPDEAVTAAKGVADILSAAESIAWSVIKASAGLAILGTMIWQLWWLIPLMFAGAIVLGAFALPVTLLVMEIKAFVKVLQKIFTNADMANVVVATKLMENIAKLLTSIGNAVQIMIDSLLPLVQGTGLFGWGESMSDQLNDKTEDMKDLIFNTGMFVKTGIIMPMRALFKNNSTGDVAHDIKVAAYVLEQMGIAMRGAGESVQSLAKNILPLVQGTGLFGWGESMSDQLNDKTEDMKDLIFNTGMFVLSGIIMPMRALFKNNSTGDVANDIKVAAYVLEQMGIALHGAGESVQSLAKNILPLVQGTGLFGWGESMSDQLNDKTEDMKDLIFNTGMFVLSGIIMPMRALFKNNSTGDVANDIKVAAYVFQSIGEALDLMAPVLWKFASPFTGLLSFLGGWLAKLIMKGGFYRLNDFIGAISKGINGLDMTGIDAGVKKLDTLVSVMENLVKIMDTLDQVITRLGNRRNKDVSAFIPQINGLIAQIAQIDTSPLTAGNANAMAIPLAVRGTVGSGTGDVNTVGVDNIHDGLVRNQAANRANSAPTQEMSQIAEATLQQVALLEKIEENTRKLAEIMDSDKVSAPRGGAGNKNRIPSVSNLSGGEDGSWGRNGLGLASTGLMAPVS